MEKIKLYKGIFWLISGYDGSEMLYCVKVPCDINGTPTTEVEFSSKSGDNFNHKAEWAKLDREITGGHAYNYYPRGRVEIKNGIATVYLNPYLNTPKTIGKVQLYFGLFEENGLSEIRIKNDGSKHYQFQKEG